MPTPTRAARGWLYNEATEERLEFQYNPVIQDKKGTHYERHRVPGRSHPVLHFVAGDSRTISFRLDFRAVEGDGSQVLDKIYWLQSLQYPTWSEGQLRESPPLVVLALGKSWAVRGVVTGVDVTIERWNHDFSEVLQATVKVDMEEYAPRSVGMRDVLRGRVDPIVRG